MTQKIKFKIPLSNNISQVIGVGMGYYHLERSGDIFWWYTDGYDPYKKEYLFVNGKVDATETEDVEGYVVPFGWEFTQGHFGFSLIAEYHHVNIEGPDNLQWITPSARFQYRF